jgi:phosphohistidine phosphatase SixA/8-oxo-dGTP pyrophosphatase MutT (NUDIX family)
VNELILAAGALVWRPAAGGTGGVEVLLVHRPRYDDWSLPKGKREPGEHLLLTAVREVFEESSVRPVLGPRLPTVEYLAGGRPKRVDYWSAVGPDSQAAASHEIDAVSWVPLAQAVGRLSYAHDATVLAALRPRPTVPLILLRHASAGQRTAHPDDDARRPLDAEGATDARLLAGLLACFAPRARVLSSPALRCLETVQPYAADFGGSVEAELALTVPRRPSGSSAGRTSIGDSLATLVRDLVAADQAAVVCLHRENLPQALAAACAALGAPSAVPDDPELPKGGFWVVHAASGTLAALERYDLREPQDAQDPLMTLRGTPE